MSERMSDDQLRDQVEKLTARTAALEQECIGVKRRLDGRGDDGFRERVATVLWERRKWDYQRGYEERAAECEAVARDLGIELDG